MIDQIKDNTLLNRAKLAALLQTLGAVEGVSGDLAEVGVYRGGVAKLMAMTCPSRTVHLFDTFKGIPVAAHNSKIDYHMPGEFHANQQRVREYLADCPNVKFHVGVFPRTAVDGTFAVVHLDTDLYATTAAGLAWFWPRLAAGGAIVLDDWNWPRCEGVTQAIREFLDAAGVTGVETEPNQLTIWKR